jgi:hypothetical protein
VSGWGCVRGRLSCVGSRLLLEPESRVALSRLPREPVPPDVFFNDTIPALFAEIELAGDERLIELAIGVVLQGDSSEDADGGAWTLHFVDGELGVSDGRGDDCDLTFIQSVEDWRSAFWGGRPRLVADLVAAIAEAAPHDLTSMRDANRPRNPEALRELAQIRGLIEAVIAGDGAEADDWCLRVAIGGGPIPDAPDATILLGVDQAEAMRRGDLHPIEALITGQLRLEGDLGLIIRLQAIAMAASMPAPKIR